MTKRERRSVINALKKARQAIEKGWAQGAEARNANGLETSVDSREACNFCSLGAIGKSTLHLRGPVGQDATNELAVDVKSWSQKYGKDYYLDWPATTITDWNDDPSRKKSQVIAMFDRTIARLEEENAA